MLRQLDGRILRVDDTLCALLERSLEKRDDVCGVARDFVCKFFIVGDQMGNVDIAEVLLDQDVLANLVSVDKSAVELESEDELL